MASVSVSHLIIFIAAMVVAASVAGVLTTTVTDISDAIDDQGPSVSDDIRSSIEIINDPGADVVFENEGNENELRLYVKNTGSRELPTEPSQIDVLINGQYSTADSVTVLPEDEDSEVWGQNDVVRIDVVGNDRIQEGENRVQITVGGADDTFVWER